MNKALGLWLALLAVPAVASAQAARNAEIARAARAYADFDSPLALRVLRPALDPAAGSLDSAWFSGVQLMAQILMEDNREPLARTWLRWAFRLSPMMRIDTVTYLPTVVAAARAAQQATRGGTPGDPVTTTRFTWPAAASTDTVGWFRTPTSASPTVRVLVEGVGILTPNQNLGLAPGTYNMQALADGYLTARVSREVLPGTITNLSFALRSATIAAADSILTTDARTRAERQMVRLTVQRYGMGASCTTGAAVSRDGLVITTYQGIRGADAIEAAFSDGPPVRTGITVAAYDVARNVAVLRVSTSRTDSLPVSQDVSDAQFAWGVGFTNCQAAAVAKTRVTSWADRPNGPLQLGDTLPAVAQNAPLLDRAGSMIGLTAGARGAVPGLHALEILAQARRNVAGAQTISVAELGKRENHLFGSLLVRSTTTGASVRITPMEAWQWSELVRQAAAPVTFAGPAGRYRVELLVGGSVRLQDTVTIAAGAQSPVSLEAPVQVATPTGAQQPGIARRKGKSPLPFVLIGGGGAAVAAIVLLKPKGTPTPDDGTTMDPGSIGISIPVVVP